MNVLRIFSLYDRVAQSSAPPIFCRNEAEAIRSVERSFQSAYQNIPGFKHTDFTLNEIGDFNTETLKITPFDAPRDVYFDFTPPKELINVQAPNNPV